MIRCSIEIDRPPHDVFAYVEELDRHKELQAIGAFVLAGGCTKTRINKVAEMIRAARGYRWVAIYKIVKKEFVILAQTGDDTFPAWSADGGSLAYVSTGAFFELSLKDLSIRTLASGDNFFFGDITWLK